MSAKDISVLVDKIIKHPILVLYMFVVLFSLQYTIVYIVDKLENRLVEKLDKIVIKEDKILSNKSFCPKSEYGVYK